MSHFRSFFHPSFLSTSSTTSSDTIIRALDHQRRQMDGHYNPKFWDNPANGQKAADLGQMFVYICTGFFFYEQILSAKYDFDTLFLNKKKLRWVHLAYFGTKISMWAYFVCSFMFFWRETEINCQNLFYALEFFMGLVTFFSSVLLSFRTYCVYQGAEQKIVLAVIAFCATGLLTAWMQGVPDVKATWHAISDPAQYKQGYCLYTAISPNYWVKYLITICFDAVILFMTTFGVARMAGRSSLGIKLINQGIVFFIVTFLANLIIAVLTLLRLSPAMSLLFAYAQSTICVLCSCRLHRSLAGERKDHISSSDINNRNFMSPPPSSRFAKLPLIGRFMQHDMAAAEPLSYSQGTVPTFVSNTTYAAKGGGLDTPMYTRSIPAYSPRNEHSDLEGGQQGYFDITPAPRNTQPTATAPVQRIESRQQLALEDMLREGPPAAGAAAAQSEHRRSVNGGVARAGHTADWVHIQVEQSVKVDEKDETL